MIRVFYRPCGNTHNEQHTAAYELLYAAAAVCGLPGGSVAKTEDGKPYFPEARETHFSLSHTEGYAVCAIGDAPCGIDIEAERTIPARIRRRYLGDAPETEAVRRWTERESYGKLDGKGFFAEAPQRAVRYVFFDSLKGYLVTVCVEAATEVAEIMMLL